LLRNPACIVFLFLLQSLRLIAWIRCLFLGRATHPKSYSWPLGKHFSRATAVDMLYMPHYNAGTHRVMCGAAEVRCDRAGASTPMPSAQMYSSLQLSMLRRIPPGIRSLRGSQFLTGETVKRCMPLGVLAVPGILLTGYLSDLPRWR
jgi:hypothetical protein